MHEIIGTNSYKSSEEIIGSQRRAICLSGLDGEDIKIRVKDADTADRKDCLVSRFRLYRTAGIMHAGFP